MIVNRCILLSLLAMASLAGCCAAQNNENYGIVEATNDLGNLDTFVRAITQDDLINKLNDEGTLNLQNDTYIVFAPNDAAFRNLPSQAWNSIMANKDDLNTLLEYHIIENPDVNDIRDLRNVGTLKALDGRNLNLSYNNGLIVNGARVLNSRMYSDGIIYITDKVLLPDDNEFLDKYNLRNLRTGYVTMRMAEPVTVSRTTNATNISERRPMSAAEKDFIDAFRTEDDLETFTQALTAADLNGDFYNRSNLTIFAPNDRAFSVIPERQLNDLLANRDDLRTLVRSHIFDRSNLTDWNTVNGSIKTLQGNELMINTTDGEFTVNNATVLRTKYYNDSIIYVINRILLPNNQSFLDRYNLTDVETRY
jgi:uncharacterized surface protein with fasciclin (FAS1) repeats